MENSKYTVLFTVERYDPSGGGVYEVISQLARRFQQAGYNVKIAATISEGRFAAGTEYIDGIEVNRFDLSGSLVNGIKGDVEAYKEFLLKQEYDVVINYAAQHAMTDICFLYSSYIDKKKIIIPCGYSGLHWPAFSKYFENLPKYLNRYNAQIFHSINYRDYEFAKSHGLTNLFLVPNGFDKKEFENIPSGFRKKYAIAEDTKFILHVANITGTKGHKEGLLGYARALIGRSVLVCIGGHLYSGTKRFLQFGEFINKFTFGWKRIIFLEAGRDEILQAFKEADVFLFCSNIEYSPLVLFESAAAGLPFIASDCGNSKEIAEWSGIGTIIETKKDHYGFSKVRISDVAKALKKYFKNKQKPIVKQSFIENYNWDALFLKYEDVVKKVLN